MRKAARPHAIKKLQDQKPEYHLEWPYGGAVITSITVVSFISLSLQSLRLIARARVDLEALYSRLSLLRLSEVTTITPANSILILLTCAFLINA